MVIEPRYKIERRELVENKEGRDGRIRERICVKWWVVDNVTTDLVDEFDLKRDAQKCLARKVESELKRDLR